jgi:hypothetical protein
MFAPHTRFFAAPRRTSRHSRKACPREGGERESKSFGADVDPRLREGDECHHFHRYGWAARPLDTELGLNGI